MKSFQNVLGDDVGVDVLGIHDSSTKAFLRYTVSLLGYGFHGDILEPSEQLRWLGPPRYDIAGKRRTKSFGAILVALNPLGDLCLVLYRSPLLLEVDLVAEIFS